MLNKDALGAWGEEQAQERLIAQGYTIVAEDKTIGKSECDIIAIKGNSIHFIEVKTRSHPDDDPVLAVTKAKKARVAKFADNYIRITNSPFIPRLDIIAINGNPEQGVLRYEHLIDAYFPSLTSLR